MPYAIALTFATDDRTTTNLLASMTIPERSRTPLAPTSVSYSIYSASVGVEDDATANLIKAGTLPLLQTDTVITENVLAGTVYKVVFVAAAKSCVPNLPVAIQISVN